MNSSGSFLIDQVQRLFREVFDQPDMHIDSNTSPEQLTEWDSVAQLKLVIAAEEAFGVEFKMDEVASIRTVGDFMRVVESQVSANDS
jgi:acyl carrier protein